MTQWPTGISDKRIKVNGGECLVEFPVPVLLVFFRSKMWFSVTANKRSNSFEYLQVFTRNFFRKISSD